MTYSFPQRAKFKIANSDRKSNSNVHLFTHMKLILIAIKCIHQSCDYTLTTTYTFSKYPIFFNINIRNVIYTFFMYMWFWN